MNTYSLPIDALIPCGKILLLASLGFSVFQVSRGELDFTCASERVIIGFCGILFYLAAAQQLSHLSDAIKSALLSFGSKDGLKELVLSGLQKAADAPGPDGEHYTINVAALVNQAWTSGIWGILTTVVNWLFMIIDFLLQCAHDVFWQLLLFVFPISCGLSPIFPRLLSNSCVYAFELSLWSPMLALVQIATASVARSYLDHGDTLGAHVTVVELLTVLLTLLIPSITHNFVSGAVSGDFGTQSKVHGMGARAFALAKSWLI